jgi:MFS family permease
MPQATFDAFGWRIAFLLGAATLPFGLWLRKSLPETLHTDETETPVQSTSSSSRLALALDHWRVVVLGLAILGSFTMTNYCFAYMTTYVQNTLRMPAGSGFAATAAGNILSIFTVLYGGRLSDRMGRWPVNVFGNLALLLSIYPIFHFVLITRSETVLVAGVTLLIVISNTPAGAFYAALAESLPKAIRGTGFATIYSVSIAALGGTTQLIVTWLIHITGNPFAPAWYMIGAAVMGQIALTLFRESAPVRLAVPAYASAAA